MCSRGHKNQCKICMDVVKPTDGLKCQGACESYVHYKCLHYTPGKIADIKNNIIAVTCPCPDCTTAVPKEYLQDPPYSCNNVLCPANMSPSCAASDCQANMVTYSQPPPVIPGTLPSCGVECEDFKVTSYPSPPNDPCMEGCTVGEVEQPKFLPLPVVKDNCTMEQMCQKVEYLTERLNQMMVEMKKTGKHMEKAQGPCKCPSNKSLQK